MKKIYAALASFWFLFAAVGANAQTLVPNLGAASAMSGTDLLAIYQGASPLKKLTGVQLAAYVYGLTSGDATISSVGAVTFATVNSNVGSFGSATNCVTFTTNAKGLITAASQATCTPALASITGMGTGVSSAAAAALNSATGLIGGLTPTNGNCVSGNGTAWTSTACPSGTTGANPTATAGDVAINGVASTFMRSDGAPAVQKGSSSAFGIVKVDNNTITASGGVITAVPGVTSRTVTSGPDTILSTDRGNIVYYNSSSSVAITQPAPSGNFAAGFFTTLCNINTGVPTVTPGSGLIGGAGTLALPTVGTAANPVCVTYQSDGTNFNIVPNYVVNAGILTAGTIPSARLGFGANVFAAAANPLSSAGGLTTTVASGTIALGTSAVSSGACSSAATTSATGGASTDTIQISFNGDPTATTGYTPAAMLTIVPWMTSNQLNVKQCNLTASSITPSPLTLNWKITR